MIPSGKLKAKCRPRPPSVNKKMFPDQPLPPSVSQRRWWETAPSHETAEPAMVRTKWWIVELSFISMIASIKEWSNRGCCQLGEHLPSGWFWRVFALCRRHLGRCHICPTRKAHLGRRGAEWGTAIPPSQDVAPSVQKEMSTNHFNP